MSRKKTKFIFLLIVPLFIAWGSVQAQDDFGDEDFGEELELEESDFSDSGSEDVAEGEFEEEEDFGEEDFSDEEFDDEEFADEEFGDEEFADEELEEDPFDDEEFADEELEEDPFDDEPIEELVEELPLEEPEPLVEESIEEPLEEPQVEELSPPTLAEEEPFTASDDPNLDYEARLHDIYVRFHKDQTNEEDWYGVVGDRSPENYTIQKNDKLWEISRTLFGDGNYWPKVWSLNSSIRNPHLIQPNNRIRFLLGDESGPPAFTIAEPEELTPEEESQEEPEVVAQATPPKPRGVEESNEPEIPPPLVVSRPVVKRLPPSLPKWQVFGERDEFDELGIDYGTRKIAELEDKIPLAAYVSEGKLATVGEVSEVEVGSRLASALQYVYVLMEPGVAQIGDSLLVVRDLGLVKSAHPDVKGFLGYSIEVQGEVQIVENIPGRNTAGGKELYRAIVSKMVNPVSVGSKLITGRVEYIELTEKGPRSQVVAQIVGGQFFNKRQVYGTESVAYLNRGSNDGIENGQILSIRENRKIRNRNTAVRSNVRPIGWMKIVKVEPNLATGIVVRAWSDILTGDVTGAGDFVQRTGQEVERIESTDTASRTLLEELDELPGAGGGGAIEDTPDSFESDGFEAVGETDDLEFEDEEFGEEDFEYEDFEDDDF